MGWLIDQIPLAYTDAVVALGAAVLGIVAGTLGTFAVLRERSLVGDALSHATLPGVCIAFIATGVKDPLLLLIGAAIAGLIGAVTMVAIERTSRIRPDAAIGVVLSGFFSLGIVLLTYISGLNDANQAGLDKYLFGQAAGLQERDIRLMLVLGALSIGVVIIGFRAFKTTLFDRDFAGATGLPIKALELTMTALLVVAVVVGVRIVGAILMVSLLIVPAVAARQFTNRLGTLLPVAALIGAVVGTAGALLSVRWLAPTGPVIVLVGFSLVVASLLFAPARGVAWRAAKLYGARRRALVDGVLIDLETAMHSGAPPTAHELAASTGRTHRSLRRAIGHLGHAGLIDRDGARIRLNESGAAAAHALLERRNLWSIWLEHGWRLSLPDAREPDPRDVRSSLGSEYTDQLLHHAVQERRA